MTNKIDINAIRVWLFEKRKIDPSFDIGVCGLDDVLDSYEDLQKENEDLKARNKWQPIESVPKNGRSILGFYKNSLGNYRVVKMRWVSVEEIEQWDAPEGFVAGFYECPQVSEICYELECDPTHWKPLDFPPTESFFLSKEEQQLFHSALRSSCVVVSDETESKEGE